MAEQTGGRSEDRFPQYSICVVRLKTFELWPGINQQQPQTLAEAGFFYLGHEDRVRCYSCGKELAGWTNEDFVWARHEMCQPTCRHVLQHKMAGLNLGSSDVDEAAQGLVVEITGAESTSEEENPVQEERDTPRNRDQEAVEKEIQKLRYQFQCKTCFKERVCMVILPCGHLSACFKCGEKLENCNRCNEPITAIVKAYCA